MPILNVAFMGTKQKSGGGGSGYGIMVDQLAIMENELAKDGYLSPGDYDNLISMAKKLMNSGALTSDQRSNIAVKVSTYEKSKSVSGLDKSSDIDIMLRSIKNEQAEDVRNAGNDPTRYMQGRVDSLESMIADLASAIDQKAQSGQDYSSYLNQYEESVNELKYRKDIFEELKSKDPNDLTPIKGAAAYVTTNRKGEIVDVDYARFDGRTGYAETNATINGMPVYGKINYKDNGANFFVLGGKTFSAADIVTPDPLNPGSYTTKKLVADVTGTLIKKGSAAPINFTSQDLTVQNYVPIGGWAKGIDGSYYKRDNDGKFRKYINGDTTKLGITDSDLITIPKVMETSLMGNSVETIDASNMIMPEAGQPQAYGGSYNPFSSENPFTTMFAQSKQSPMNANSYTEPAMSSTPQAPAAQPMSQATSRTKSPTERAPQGFWGNAANTMSSGINYFKGLFS